MNPKHPAKSLAAALHNLGMHIKAIVEPCNMECGSIKFMDEHSVYISITQSSFFVVQIVDGTEVCGKERSTISDLLHDLYKIGAKK